jgi:hypothetical protein
VSSVAVLSNPPPKAQKTGISSSLQYMGWGWTHLPKLANWESRLTNLHPVETLAILFLCSVLANPIAQLAFTVKLLLNMFHYQCWTVSRMEKIINCVHLGRNLGPLALDTNSVSMSCCFPCSLNQSANTQHASLFKTTDPRTWGQSLFFNLNFSQ